MKKTLLSAVALFGLLAVNAQSFTNHSTGFTIDYTGTNPTYSSCVINLGTGGLAFKEKTTASVVNNKIDPKQLVITAVATPNPLENPSWIDILYTSGEGETATCNRIKDDGLSLDLSGAGNGKVQLIGASASVDNAVLEFYLSAAPAYPSQGETTYLPNPDDNTVTILESLNLTTTPKDYLIDFTANPAWADWAGSNAVIGFGVKTLTGSAVYNIQQIQFGSNVVTTSTTAAVLPANVNYYPNPSNSIINVANINVSTLKVSDMNGNVVRTSSTSNVSVEGLASGLYFLQINEFKPVKVMVK